MPKNFFELLQNTARRELFKSLHQATEEEIQQSFLIMDTIKKNGTQEEIDQLQSLYQTCLNRKNLSNGKK